MARGAAIYTSHCAMCHQVSGEGVPPAFPPLAKSDWLMADRARAVAVLAEGLSGEIIVNGQKYDGIMPAQMLDDRQVADVLTFVTNSWGNQAEEFTPQEVAAARKKTRFSTYEKLVGSTTYRPLPPAPEGWVVSEVARLNEYPTRFAGHTKEGSTFVLMQSGAVLSLKGKTLRPWLQPSSYLPNPDNEATALGATIGPSNHLWITTNEKIEDAQGMLQNHVNIWRSSERIVESESPEMLSWFQVTMPYGVGPFNHGVSHIAFGPDQNLYISSGSRTDSGEMGNVDNIAKVGETPLTACIWRFTQDLEEQKTSREPEIYARGLRNPYGFAWDGEGNLFAAANGPDADVAEELDVIIQGNHYGFPYQFADHPASEKFYKHTPPKPKGLSITKPVLNLGPDGGKGFSTFTPHSSPGGIIWCGPQFPEPLGNSLVVSRFGNFIECPEDTGFDVLTLRPRQTKDGTWETTSHTVLSPLGRPIDVMALPDYSILILEYSRATDQKSRMASMPGRIIRLQPEKN